MYQIYADDTLIYDSKIDTYNIGKGEITLEIDKAGSFVFSLYPDHPYYDKFVRLKTVIKVYKGGNLKFRGRVLNDVTDYWNNKVITCEGELTFLQDSIIRPFDFSGTPEELFTKFINEHNKQVDGFKKFKIGTVFVEDTTGDGKIERSNSAYESTLSNMNSRLLDAATTGGHFIIEHHNNEDIPTIHYWEKVGVESKQIIEFGENLKDYTKTIKGEEIATAIIPLGAELSNGKKLTISTSTGRDYVYNQSGVDKYGWIFKVVEWENIKTVENLKKTAQAYVDALSEDITIELTAIDLHLIDRSIESFNVCEYIRVVSPPHNMDMTLLCTKQVINLLKPENDSIILGCIRPTLYRNNKGYSKLLYKITNGFVKKDELKDEIDNVIADGGYVTEEDVDDMINDAINNSGGGGNTGDGDDTGDDNTCQHRDENDDGLCDICGEPFTDGDDTGGGDNTGGDNTGGDNTGGDDTDDDMEEIWGEVANDDSYDEQSEDGATTIHNIDTPHLYANGSATTTDGNVSLDPETNHFPIYIRASRSIWRLSVTFNRPCVFSCGIVRDDGTEFPFTVDEATDEYSFTIYINTDEYSITDIMIWCYDYPDAKATSIQFETVN